MNVGGEEPVESLTKDEALEYVKQFEQFSTYFTGFNENRANVYDCGILETTGEPKSTSIAHRLFIWNIEFHFGNIWKWEKLKKTLEPKELKNKFQEKLKESKNPNLENLKESDFDNIFKPENFLNHFAQKDIDLYNDFFSGARDTKEGDERLKGLNEVVNLTSQAAQGERKDYHTFDNFYKQILSKKDGIFIDLIENEEDFFEAIKECEFLFEKNKKYNKEKNLDLLEKFQKEFFEHFESLQKDKSEWKKHFIDIESLRNFLLNYARVDGAA